MFRNMMRYAELYKRFGTQVEIMNNILWKEYNGMIVPVGPSKLNYSISKEEARFLLSKMKKGLLVRFTEGFSNENCKEWYAVICDRFVEYTELPNRENRKFIKGFRNCNVQKVEAKYIAEHGYPVLISAINRYRGLRKNITEGDFRKRILITEDFDDIVHYWGVFHNNMLVGYSILYIYDNIEADTDKTIINPVFLKLNASYALKYSTIKYYLKDNSFENILSGYRTILHKTESQNFLIRHFNYKKAYSKLNVVYSPYLHAYLSITFPIRNLLGKINPKLEALYKLEEIRRKETHE